MERDSKVYKTYVEILEHDQKLWLSRQSCHARNKYGNHQNDDSRIAFANNKGEDR